MSFCVKSGQASVDPHQPTLDLIDSEPGAGYGVDLVIDQDVPVSRLVDSETLPIGLATGAPELLLLGCGHDCSLRGRWILQRWIRAKPSHAMPPKNLTVDHLPPDSFRLP